MVPSRPMRSLVLSAALLISALTACGGPEAKGPPADNTVGPHPVGVGGEKHEERDTKRVEALTGWTKLGERTVNGKADHDTIAVGKAEGKFKTIQIKVEHSSLEMFDVRVTFSDDTMFSPPTRLVFHNGEISKPIDLPGGERVIKKVEFNYGNLAGGGNASVELWAK